MVHAWPNALWPFGVLCCNHAVLPTTPVLFSQARGGTHVDRSCGCIRPLTGQPSHELLSGCIAALNKPFPLRCNKTRIYIHTLCKNKLISYPYRCEYFIWLIIYLQCIYCYNDAFSPNIPTHGAATADIAHFVLHSDMNSSLVCKRQN